MATQDDRAKLIALAHLKLGKTAREASEIAKISYPMAINLRNQLKEAEDKNAIYELFNLDEIALNTLLDTVKEKVLEHTEVDGEPVSELVDEKELTKELASLKKSVTGLASLETELQETAVTLIRQIKLQAVLANSSDTVLNLAEALAKIQVAFFAKGTTVQVANFNGSGKGKFEEFLSE